MIRIALSGLLLVFLVSCAGRNLHRNVTADPSILTRGWTLATHETMREAGERGYDYSSPVRYENTLIFGSQGRGLTSLYPRMGRIRWTLPIEGGVLSELAVHRNLILFGGGDGFFYAVNGETGKVAWKYETRNTLVSRPTLAGGRVFFTTPDDTVYALDAGTGKWLWHYKRRSTTAATIQGASAPLIDSNEAIVGMSDGFLIGLSVDDGSLKWERKLHTGTKFTDIDASPVLSGDMLYIPSYDGALYALKRNGAVIQWRYDAGGSKSVVQDDSRLYLPSSDGKIIALDRVNAKVIWEFPLDRGTPTKVVSTGRYLIFGSSFQYLYVLDKSTGKPLYRWNAGDGSGFSGSPVLDQELKSVYLLSMAGNLYQFNLRAEPRAGELYRSSAF